MQELSAILGVSKYNDGADLFFHKRKDGSTQLLYCYTIHGYRGKMSLGALRAVS